MQYSSLSLVAIKCRLRGVPDELRQSLSRSLGSTSADDGAGSSSEAGEEKEAEPHLDHPYDIITRVRIDLEPYVLLVQVGGNKHYLCYYLSRILGCTFDKYMLFMSWVDNQYCEWLLVNNHKVGGLLVH